MTRDQIKALALRHGFTLKEGDDLRPYVYEFAEALLDAARSEQKPVAWMMADGQPYRVKQHRLRDGAEIPGQTPLFSFPVIPSGFKAKSEEEGDAYTHGFFDGVDHAKSEVVPQGWRLVPEDGTDEMVRAGNIGQGFSRDALRAAIAAAPQPKEE